MGGFIRGAVIKDNYEQVLESLQRAAKAAHRDPEEVRLVVVTKGQHLEAIQAVVEAGARRLGENYAEEAEGKILALGGEPEVEWHMIGHIQGRKARLVCELFQCVHSLDSLKIAERLSRFAGEMSKPIPVLLECNTSGEQSKFGFQAWSEEQWAALADQARQINELDHLELRGLMTMAPFFDHAEPARPYFSRLRRLRNFLAHELPGASWDELSMGMSGDYPVAVEEGATLVRIGQAILGSRKG